MYDVRMDERTSIICSEDMSNLTVEKILIQENITAAVLTGVNVPTPHRPL